MVFLSLITMQEAVLSSQIEGTQATLGDVYKFEAGDEPIDESRRHDIFEILNYRRAMGLAEKSLSTRPFNLNLLKGTSQNLIFLRISLIQSLTQFLQHSALPIVTKTAYVPSLRLIQENWGFERFPYATSCRSSG